MLHVDAQAHRGGEVAHQRLDDTEHAERLFREQGILRQADECANEESANLAAAHQRKIDGHQQGQFQVSELIEETRHVNLEKDRGQGHEQQDARPESRDLLALVAHQEAIAGFCHWGGG